MNEVKLETRSFKMADSTVPGPRGVLEHRGKQASHE